MTDYEARYQSSGEDLENSYGGVPSPQPREGSHGGLDDQRGSKSQVRMFPMTRSREVRVPFSLTFPDISFCLFCL